MLIYIGFHSVSLSYFSFMCFEDISKAMTLNTVKFSIVHFFRPKEVENSNCIDKFVIIYLKIHDFTWDQ